MRPVATEEKNRRGPITLGNVGRRLVQKKSWLCRVPNLCRWQLEDYDSVASLPTGCSSTGVVRHVDSGSGCVAAPENIRS
jgi:hypothetical protein